MIEVVQIVRKIYEAETFFPLFPVKYVLLTNNSHEVRVCTSKGMRIKTTLSTVFEIVVYSFTV